MLDQIYKYQLHLKRLAWMKASCLLLSLFTVLIICFTFLGSLFLQIGLGLALLIMMAWLMRHIAVSYHTKARDLVRESELRLFGRRRLVLDSALELDQSGLHPDLLTQNIHLMENQTTYPDWSSELKRSALRALISLLVSLVVVLSLGGMALPPFIEEIQNIKQFLQGECLLDMPEFYRENEAWTLDLTELSSRFSGLEVQVDSDILSSSNHLYIIGEKWTSRDSLALSIRAHRKGLTRILYQGKIEQLRSFLPGDISVTIRYPFSTEEYFGLQDLEVWAGARITVQGKMNYSISNVSLPGIAVDTSLDSREFKLAFSVYRSRELRLEVEGEHDLHYSSAPFKIQVLPNQSPRIRLLFPGEDVVLRHYQWRVQALVEAEDEQGIQQLAWTVIITNKDPELSFKQEQNYTKTISHLRFIREELELKYSELEMLPGDVASVRIWARDSLGKLSATVGFNIISPDIWQLQEQREQLQKKLEKTTATVQDEIKRLKEDVKHDNLSGAEQKAKEIERQTREMAEDVKEMTVAQAAPDQAQEVRDSLKRMEEITRKLKQYSETLQDMQKWMQGSPPQAAEMEKSTRSMDELLREFEAMLDNLEFYKKYTDLAQQFELLRQDYEQLKQSGDTQDFKRKMENYQKGMKDFEKLAFPDMKDKIQALQRESEKIDPAQSRSYDQSDKLMQELARQVQEKLHKAGQDRNEKRQQELERILHELFLDQIILDQARALDPGQAGHYDPRVLAEIVQNVNALIVSMKDSRQRLEDAVSGLLFSDPQSLKALEELVGRNLEILEMISDSLRDNRMNEVALGLTHSANHVSQLFYKVLQLNQALKDAMQKSQNGQQSQPQMSLSMDQLMQMQSRMSSSLQDLMKQMQQQGGMSPQMKEMMDQMAKLQSQIRDNLGQAMQQGQDGLLSEGQETFGMMDDIIKDLESHKVNATTLEKSKKLEEKLLKAKKSLQSKGISQKRKADSPGQYQVEIVPDILDDDNYKIDLDSIESKKLDGYYKKLVEKYRSLQLNESK